MTFCFGGKRSIQAELRARNFSINRFNNLASSLGSPVGPQTLYLTPSLVYFVHPVCTWGWER